MALYGTLEVWCSADRLHLSWLCTWSQRGGNSPSDALFCSGFFIKYSVPFQAPSLLSLLPLNVLVHIIQMRDVGRIRGAKNGCHLLLDLNNFCPETLWLKSSRGRLGLPMEPKFGAAAKTTFYCVKLLILNKRARP